MEKKEKRFQFYIRRVKEGRLRELVLQTAWLYAYVRKYRMQIVLYMFIGLIGTAVSLVSSIVSKNMVDIITGHQTGGLVRTFCIFIGVTVGSILITQLSNYVSSMISLHVDTEMKADVFDKMLVTDLEAFTSYHTGDLLTRWNSDVSTVSSGVLNWIPDLVIYFVKFISAFAVVVYYDPMFALLAMMGIPVGLCMSRTVLKRIQNNNKEAAAMNARLSGFNQETFSNIQTIKAFDLLRAYSQKLRQYQKEYKKMRSNFLRLSMVTSLIMSIVGVAISYSCYALGIYRVWSGAISYGTMTLFLSLANTLTGTLNDLISLIPTAISITTSASRLMDILDMPKEDFSMRDEVSDFYRRHIQEGVSVRLSNITYSYHTGKTVFSNASFEAHPHQITALVGPSGEGKTTILRIILSMLHPQEGSLEIACGGGGECIPASPAIRQLFSYVPQGNTMFSGTIADNLRIVKPDASDEDLICVLREACAWDFVSALPDGIYSKIGERGHGFSEGQSQRLSIARALLRNSPILLLDESTSALDIATERRILKNILRDTYPRTCIITTHRPTALHMCDHVYAISEKQCSLLDKEGIEELIHQF